MGRFKEIGFIKEKEMNKLEFKNEKQFVSYLRDEIRDNVEVNLFRHSKELSTITVSDKIDYDSTNEIWTALIICYHHAYNTYSLVGSIGIYDLEKDELLKPYKILNIQKLIDIIYCYGFIKDDENDNN